MHSAWRLRVAEVFAHRAARIGREVLHGRGIGRRGRNHDGVLHGAVVFERLHHLRHGRTLLADGDVDANHVAALLIDDGVERDGGLAGLAVADDQLALAAADRNHGVDGLDAGLQRLFHRLAVDHAGRQALDGVELLGLDRTLAVDGLPERVRPRGRSCASPTGTDMMRPVRRTSSPSLMLGEFAQQHRAHLVFFQVQGDAGNAVRELDQLAGHDLFQAVDAGDTVAHRDHRAGFGDVDRAFVIFDLLRAACVIFRLPEFEP